MFVALKLFILYHHFSFTLLLLCDVRLAGISEVGESVLLLVCEHAAHHLCLVEVEGCPLPPKLETGRSGVGVEALHVVGKLLVSLFGYHLLKVFDVLAAFFGECFMLSNLFVLHCYFIMSTVLLLSMLIH